MSDHHEVSHVFRSTFPADFEREDFRTGAWRVIPKRPEDLKPLHATMLHAFAAAARLEDRTGITLVDEEGEEQHRSYANLYAQSRHVAAALHKRGVRKGDRVLLVLPTSFEFVSTFFGIQRLGAIPCPSYPPAALEKAEVGLARIEHIARHSDASVCVATNKLLPLLGSLAAKVKSLHDIVPVEALTAHRSRDAQKAVAHSGDPAFIQYTSGSTGHPKGVLLSQGNIVANIHAAGMGMRVGRRDVGLSWLPLYHDMGLIGGLLFNMYWRLPLVLMAPTTFLLRPSLWLQAMTRHRCTLTASPNFGYALCVKRVRPRDREGLDLSSMRCALNGAEPVNQQTVDQFLKEFAPYGFRPEAMFPVYGLAESSLAVTFPRPGDRHKHLTVDRAALAAGWVEPGQGAQTATLVAVGKAVPGHEVQVVDEKGGATGLGEVGHVIARGPSIMQGYFRDPLATQAVLSKGWLWTGDLGFFDKDGDLYIAGRARDLIIIRGKNYYAEDVEHVIERQPGVRGGGAVAFAVYDEEKAGDLVVAIVEVKDLADKALAARVTEAVASECGIQLDEVVLARAGTIPKTSSGKRQRALCREQYLKGGLGPARTNAIDLARVFVRSGSGFLSLLRKRLKRRLRLPATEA
ncbi:MAG: fatty acyl-AMP ligase [Myxococcales bacterium]